MDPVSVEITALQIPFRIGLTVPAVKYPLVVEHHALARLQLEPELQILAMQQLGEGPERLVEGRHLVKRLVERRA